MNLCSYWRAVLAQDADGMRAFLAPDAVVRWPNTRERFTAEDSFGLIAPIPAHGKAGWNAWSMPATWPSAWSWSSRG